jgi:hypothetical protein
VSADFINIEAEACNKVSLKSFILASAISLVIGTASKFGRTICHPEKRSMDCICNDERRSGVHCYNTTSIHPQMKRVSNGEAGFKPEQKGGEGFTNLNDDSTLIVLLSLRLKMLKNSVARRTFSYEKWAL